MADAVDTACRRLQRDFGLRARELRLAAGLPQAAVAKSLKMALTNYIRVERGRRNLTLHTVARIAVALGVPPSELFKPPVDRNPRPGRPPKARG